MERKDYHDEFVIVDAHHNILGVGPHKVLVEGWWDDINGGVGWGESQHNPAAIIYGIRTGFKENVPWDNEVLYGHIQEDRDHHGLGILFHETEIVSGNGSE